MDNICGCCLQVFPILSGHAYKSCHLSPPVFRNNGNGVFQVSSLYLHISTLWFKKIWTPATFLNNFNKYWPISIICHTENLQSLYSVAYIFVDSEL